MLTYATPETATPSQLALHRQHKARQARMRAAVPKRLAPPKPKAPGADEIRAQFRIIEWLRERPHDAHVRAWYRRDGLPRMDEVIADFRAACPVAWSEIISKRRHKEVVVWRQALMHALSTETGATLKMVADRFGVDHTTVSHAKMRIKAAIEVRAGQWIVGPCGHRFFVRHYYRKGAR